MECSAKKKNGKEDMNEECKIVEEIYTDVERQNFFEYS
jgi:hypothetical protein